MGKSITIEGGDYLFRGEVEPPADKSISHRAIILCSLNEGISKINNVLMSKDIQSTVFCFEQLGVEFSHNSNNTTVNSKGINGFSPPKNILNCGNSGTTARLLSGILVGQPFSSILDGDSSLRTRPMKRIEKPLRDMGANISTNNGYLPIKIKPSTIKGRDFLLDLGSAQVKSSILLAGLYGENQTKFKDRKKSRDHTETMLMNFTDNIKFEEDEIIIKPSLKINLQEISVPGDPSSAAFFVVATLINKNAELCIKNLCLNPMRIHFIDILKRMGGDIKISNLTLMDGENTGDITVKSSKLRGVNITEESIPALIDEIPILSLACALAEGESTISGASELRFKESDRIKSIVSELKKFGCDIIETDDGLKIIGKEDLEFASCYSHQDHRIAMMAAVAATKARGITTINDVDCVSISFPNFFKILGGFQKK